MGNRKPEPQGRLFLSGPFTGQAQRIRWLIKEVGGQLGIEFVEKIDNATPPEPVAELIKGADATVHVYGELDAAIRTAWGHSLPEEELRFSMYERVPSLAVLFGEERDDGGRIAKMRWHLRKALNGGCIELPMIADGYGVTEFDDLIWLLSRSAAGEIGGGRPSEPFHDQMVAHQLRGVLNRARLEWVNRIERTEGRDGVHRITPVLQAWKEGDLDQRLFDIENVAGALEEFRSQVGSHAPGVEAVERAVTRLEGFLGDWSSRASHVGTKVVFLSYAREDAAYAEAISSEVAESDIVCWMDETRLDVGQNFGDKIHNAIEHASVFLVLMSRSAVTSEWVRREVEHALRCERRFGDDFYYIIPVFLEAVEPPATDEVFVEVMGRHGITLQGVDEAREKVGVLLGDVGQRMAHGSSVMLGFFA